VARGLRLSVGVAAVCILLVVIGVAMRRVSADRVRSRQAIARTSTTSPPRLPPSPRRVPAWPADVEGRAPSEDQAYKADPAAPHLDTAAAWARVDFDEIRRALPDSLYWTMAFPTKDPALLEQRERTRAEWNVQYGKVLSNTATDEEIDAYYAIQQQLSEDYIEFLVYLAEHYGDVVPRSEVGALKLAGEMHLARLEEIPRKIAEAKERHAQHEATRRAWLEDQQRFAPSTVPPR
jgi:hypothetical protein